MYSTMSERKMVSLARSLQTIHAIAAELIPGDFPPRSLLRVVAFKNTRAFLAEFQSDEFIGFMQPSMRQHTLAFGLGSRSYQPLVVAFHEYTHYVSRSRYEIFIPLWYEEGFAQYLGATRQQGNKTRIGEVNSRRLHRAISRHKTTWQTTLDGVPRLDWHEHNYASHYAFAHAVVHFLHHGFASNGEPMSDKVYDILLAISNGGRASQVVPEFAGVAPAEFIPTLHNHLRETRPLTYTKEYDSRKFSAVQERQCLSEIESRKLLANTLIRINPARAFEHVERALMLAPQDPELQVILSYLPAHDTLSSYDRIQRALEFAPDNEDAHVRMGDLLSYNCLDVHTQECDYLREIASQHYRRALHRDPYRVDAAFGLGVSLLKSSRAGDGLNYLRVAHQRVPWNARVNYFLGAAYLQIGNLKEGVQYLNRAALWEEEVELRNQAISLMETVP